MSKETSLSKLTGIYMIGNFSSRILSFILVFFLTYFLTREEMGQYDLILTSISFIVPCVSLQLDSALMRWLLDKDKSKSNEIVFQNVFLVIGINFTIYTIGYLLLDRIIHFRYSELVYLFSIFQLLFQLFQQGTRGLGKNKLYASSSVIYSFLYLISTVCAVFFFDLGVSGILIGNIISLILIISYIFFKNSWYKYLGFKKIDWSFVKEMLAYSVPLLPNTLSWWFIGSATRYVILLYLGVEENGLYAISYKYPSILLILSSVFNLAWQEKAIRNASSENVSIVFSITLRKYIKILLGIIIVLTTISKFLMGFVDETYFEAWKYIPILLYAVFLKSIAAFYGVGYLTEKKTKGVFYSSVIGALVTIGLSFILTPILRLNGVGISILLGYCVLLIVRIIHIKTFMKIDFPYKLIILLTLIFILLSLINLSDNILITIIGFLVSIGVFVVINFDQVNIVKQKIFKTI